MDKVFVQFYKKTPYFFDDKIILTSFRNGLSLVYEQIKDPILWVEESYSIPPIKRGELFASCWYNNDVFTLEKWARDNPDLTVNVCGPVITYYPMSIGEDLPNMKYLQGNAEDLFFNGKTSDWKLDIKKIDGPISYTVSLLNGRGCYWGKCIFCRHILEYKYRDIKEIPIIEHPDHKYIWIHVEAIPPKFIRSHYKKLPNRSDVTYITYIRADKDCKNAYLEVVSNGNIDPKFLYFDIGLEFPSNRMLKYMNKGLTTEDYLNFIDVLVKNGSGVHLNLIVNWPHITEDDVSEVKKFLDDLHKISGDKRIAAQCNSLFVVHDRLMYNSLNKDCLIENSISKTKKHKVYNIKLNEEQKYLNKKIVNMYSNYPFSKFRLMK